MGCCQKTRLSRASRNYQIFLIALSRSLFLSHCVCLSLLCIKLDNGQRSDKLQVVSQSRAPCPPCPIFPFHLPFFISHFGLIACQKRLTVPRAVAALPLPLSLSFFFFWAHCEGSSVYLANCEKQFSLSCLDSPSSSLFDGLFQGL